jgi:hypothetical protein
LISISHFPYYRSFGSFCFDIDDIPDGYFRMSKEKYSKIESQSRRSSFFFISKTFGNIVSLFTQEI